MTKKQAAKAGSEHAEVFVSTIHKLGDEVEAKTKAKFIANLAAIKNLTPKQASELVREYNKAFVLYLLDHLETNILTLSLDFIDPEEVGKTIFGAMDALAREKGKSN